MAFHILAYRMAVPYLSTVIYFLYKLDAPCTISLASLPFSVIVMSLFKSECKNAPGISKHAMLRPLQASTTTVMNTNFVNTVGNVVSCLLHLPCCPCPSAHICAFTVVSLFYFENMSKTRAFFCSSLLSNSCITAQNMLTLCIWVSSLITPASPHSWNFIIPISIK
jgi:hypothetical protein